MFSDHTDIKLGIKKELDIHGTQTLEKLKHMSK
jgi:hypothetical protein